MPTLAICVISHDSISLPLITWTCFLSFSSWRGIWWWRAKSWCINAMPIAPQSISVYIGISWSIMINVQVITKCLPSIDSSNISTLLTDNREIPKHFKAYTTKLFLSTNAPSCSGCANLFPIRTSLISAPAILKIWGFFLATHSATLWLHPLQYNQLPSANLFAPSLAKIPPLPTLRSIGAVLEAFGGGGGLGEVKPIPPPWICAAFSSRHFRIWLSYSWQTVTNAGSFSGISL